MVRRYIRGVTAPPPKKSGIIRTAAVGCSQDFFGLIGYRVHLHGAEDPYFRLGNVVYKVVEDENDGYRSSMDTVLVPPPAEIPSTLRLVGAPLDTVLVTQTDRSCYARNDYAGSDCDLYQLISATDAHVWLEFGTLNIGDYYPALWFKFFPKPPAGAR